MWGAVVALAAFPPATFWPLALAAPTPLWLGARGAGPAVGFRRGLCYGLGFFSTLLWWIVPTVTQYGKLPGIAGVSCLLLLASYLALYPAGAGWFVSRVCAKRPGAGLALAPFAWTALEWVRGWLLSGFPWGDLPQALWRCPWALGLAPWLGIDGVRLVIASTSVAAAWGVGSVAARRRLALVSLLPSGCVLASAVVLALIPASTPLPSRLFRVGVVQGNIDQSQKWDPAFRRSTLKIYAERTRWLAEKGAQLVVWPETAVPFAAQNPGPESRFLSAVAAGTGVPLVFGAPAYEEGPGGVEYRNAVFLMTSSGRLADRYDKVHLVPFGEYVPLGRFFPFVKKLVEGAGDFTAGPGVRPLSGSESLPGLGALVCFEVIFPEFASRHLAAGAQMLTVVTNDGWFGRTPGPYQHLAFAAWRAAETGLPLVRAANTGVSAVFDSRGLLQYATEIQSRDAFVFDLNIPLPHRTPQLFVRPWVSPLCAGLAVGGLFVILRRPRPGGTAPQKTTSKRRYKAS